MPGRTGSSPGIHRTREEDFEFGKDWFGLDQSQVRLYTAIARHTVLVMAALAVCAVTAALLRRHTGTQEPAPILPDQLPSADPGMTPLTVPESGRLLGHPPARQRRELLLAELGRASEKRAQVIALAMVLGAAEHGVRDVHTWQSAEGSYWASHGVPLVARYLAWLAAHRLRALGHRDRGCRLPP